MWEPLNLPFGKQIWRRVLAHETPAGAVFGTVPAGVFCMPTHARFTLCGWGFGLFPGYMLWVPWVRGLYRGGLEAALLDWKYRGPPSRQSQDDRGEYGRERAHLHRQANTDKRIQAGEDAQVLNPAARAVQDHLGSL